MTHTGEKRKSRESGFTLIELSIVLMMMAVTMLPLLQMYSLARLQQIQERTKSRAQIVDTALSEFKSAQGRYPCPALLTAKPGDADYGREDCSPGAPTRIANPPGAKDADLNGIADDDIMIGAIPFATMLDPDGDPSTFDGVTDTALREFHTLDGWGRKYTYAVTEDLTNALTFNEKGGVIDVVDENNVPVLPAVNVSSTDPLIIREMKRNAHLVIISHGENGRGGWTRSGASIGGCGSSVTLPPPPSGEVAAAQSELQNCNDNAQFVQGLLKRLDHSYFDDLIRIKKSESVFYWGYNEAGDKVINTNPGNVGMNVNNPEQKLDIKGGVKAFEMRAGMLCDSSGADCMPPDVLGGNLPQMQCAYPNEVIVSVSENKVQCQVPFHAPVAGTCEAGKYLIGFKTDGTIICDSL